MKSISNLECQFCGKEFTRNTKYIKLALKRGQVDFYCSPSCAKSKQHLITNCLTCGKLITRLPSSERNQSGKYYCSRSCAASANNKLKSGTRHPNYIDGRGCYRNHLKNKCEGCGNDQPYLLVIHHKDKNRKNNEKSNLETLCHNCHALRHLVLLAGKLAVNWTQLTTEEAALQLIFKT